MVFFTAKPIDLVKLKELSLTGMTNWDMAKQFGCSETHVRKARSIHGLTCRELGIKLQVQAPQKDFVRQHLDAILAARHEGKKWDVIAAPLGMTGKMLSHCLRRMDALPRNLKEVRTPYHIARAERNRIAKEEREKIRKLKKKAPDIMATDERARCGLMPLPTGHPISWGLITKGTLLEDVSPFE